MAETVLDAPTVADLIAHLQALPQGAPLRIRDADTGWTILTVHIDHDANGTVWLSGEYHEMTSGTG